MARLSIWIGAGMAFSLSTLALPTCTGFFFAIFLFQGVSYLPIGLITLVDLILSGLVLKKIGKFSSSLSQGLWDAVKLNIFLGLIVWTFYFMPYFGPIVARWL